MIFAYILAGCDGGTVAIGDDLPGRVEVLEAGFSQVSAELATAQAELATAQAELATAQADLATEAAATEAAATEGADNDRETAAALEALARRVEILEAIPVASIQGVSSETGSYSASAAYFETIDAVIVSVIAGQSVAAWCVLVDETGGQYRVTVSDGDGWTEEGPAVRASGQATALDTWTATDTGDLLVTCEGQGNGVVSGFSLTALVL